MQSISYAISTNVIGGCGNLCNPEEAIYRGAVWGGGIGSLGGIGIGYCLKNHFYGLAAPLALGLYLGFSIGSVVGAGVVALSNQVYNFNL